MLELHTWVLSGKRYRETVDVLEQKAGQASWCLYFGRQNPTQISPGALESTCRLEPVPMADCYVERFFLLDRSGKAEQLAGAGLTIQIRWDGQPANLPGGWQDTIRRGYRDSGPDGGKSNTIVGMLAFTTGPYQKQGVAGRVLSEMLRFGRDRGHRFGLVPALCPTQFQREYVETAARDLATLTRDDGLPLDYWLRLHVRKGADIVGHSERSHRFALSLADFAEQVSSDVPQRTGDHIVRLNKDPSFGMRGNETWQRVYADVERDFVTFDWKCVWVRYDLESVSLDG